MLQVYTKKNCPFCDQAKALLKRKNINFEEIQVDIDTNARKFIVEEGHRTVPQIYKDGKVFVEGGYSGLAKLTEQELNEKLGI